MNQQMILVERLETDNILYIYSLKDNITMASTTAKEEKKKNEYDTSLTACNVAMKSFAGRDKVVRMIQYGSRFLRGFLPAVGQISLGQQFNSVFLRTISDRRTYRWLNAFPTLIKLSEILNGTTSWAWGKQLHKKLLFTLYNVLILSWEIFDHVRWFAEVKWLNFERRFHWMRVSFSLFTCACIVSAIHHIEESYFKKHESEAKEKLVKRNMQKFILHILTFSHIAQLTPLKGTNLGEMLCGFCGTWTSLMDLHTLWPKMS